MGGSIYPVAFEGQSPDEFGRPAPRFGILTIPLDNARELEEYTIGGNILWCITATSLGKLCEVTFQDYTSARVPYGQGQFIGGIPYSRIYVSNEAQPGESITFLYAVESGQQGLRIDNPLQDAGNVVISDPGTAASINTPARQTLTTSPAIVSAQDISKREVVIQADPDNAGNIVVGDSNITDTRGIILQPGQTAVINASAAVYALQVAAGANYIHVLETKV